MDLKSYSISPRKRAIALGNRFRPKLQRGLAIDERHSITVSKKFPEWGLKPQEHLFHNLSSLPDCLTLLLCSRRSEVKCLIRCVHDSPQWTQSKGPQRPSSCYLCRNSSARPREMASNTLRIASMRTCNRKNCLGGVHFPLSVLIDQMFIRHYSRHFASSC